MSTRTERLLIAGIFIAASAITYFTFGILGTWDAYPQQSTQVGLAVPQGPAVFETSLQDRISSTDTSLSLVSATVRGGTALSGFNCFTLDEGRTDMEYVCGTVSGTTVSSLTRGVDPVTATTTNATVRFAHRKGANVKITDFPLVQRLRALANGNDTFPNLLYYTSGTACSGSSINASICDKAYIDGVAVAGASNANLTTKGIIELATGAQAGSSTATDTTGASLGLYTGISTSSPYTPASVVPVTMPNGKLKQAFLDLAEGFTWLGAHIFSGLTTFTATSTMATSTVASSTITNLNVANITGVTSVGGLIGTWRQLAATTTSVAMTWATTTFSGVNTLRIEFIMPSAASDEVGFQFNGDSSLLYSSTSYINYANPAGIIVNGARNAYFGGIDQSTTTNMHVVMDISSNASLRKQFAYQGSATNASFFNPYVFSGAGVWNNTSSQITSIAFALNTGSFPGGTIPSGTIIRVFGQ
jgi:hypothetical protein